MTKAASLPLNPRLIIEGPQDRDPEEADLYEPGRDWSLRCYQPAVEELTGVRGDTLEAQTWIESQLSPQVRSRLAWDSEGGMLAVDGSRADILSVAHVMQRSLGD